ncbi:MAG: hypothetical protein C5B50_24400 [Verrucomicrobia bacterium]|nr:MAG: hypothetical protein C5B50_24400 [Verrucomicrobiota bacterium]
MLASIFDTPEGAETVVSWQKLNPNLREGIIMCLAFLTLTALVFIWAIFFRKRFRLRRRRSRRHRSHSPVATVVSTAASQSAAQSASGAQIIALAGAQASNGPPASSEQHHHGRRRRRRRERPLNPTLAQTGGLPRIRTQAPPDSPF